MKKCNVHRLMRSLLSTPATGQVSAGNQGVHPCAEKCATTSFSERLRSTDYVDLSTEAAQAGCAGLPRHPVEEKE